MRYVVVVAGLALLGCDDPGPVEPRELGPYEVNTLRTLSEGTAADFVDLNENGQALWHEGEEAVLWDDGAVLDVPVGRFLGSSGEVVGESSVWIQGQLTELPGTTRGITEDGTVFFSRNDTMFTWRDGTTTATERAIGQVGPEGRIWNVHIVVGELATKNCGFYFEGVWHTVVTTHDACSISNPEENGRAIITGFIPLGGGEVGEITVVPDMYEILDSQGRALDLAHINSEGHAVAFVGIVGQPDGTRVDLRNHYGGTITLGAINDDGEILAQLNDEIVLLTPR